MTSFNYFIRQAGFVIRIRKANYIARNFRKLWLSFLGMKVGKNTVLPKMHVTWPHQVSIGNKCILEHNISFKFDGIQKPGPSITIGDKAFIGSGCEFNIRKAIHIGNDALIASGCKFIDHDHGYKLGSAIRVQHGVEAEITIGNDVWLGCNVVVLKGVTIGNGGIVAAGAVVTKSIPENEVWGGIPARKLSDRK